MKPTQLSGTFGSMDSFLFQGTQPASIPFPASVNRQRAAPFFAGIRRCVRWLSDWENWLPGPDSNQRPSG
jgi:hypothetical protein